MKASLLLVASLAVTVISAAPANADRRQTSQSSTQGCNGGNWPTLSPTCQNLGNFKTYAECMEGGAKIGWRSNDSWWYCSSLGFKN
jgi:hypothetical protein